MGRAGQGLLLGGCVALHLLSVSGMQSALHGLLELSVRSCCSVLGEVHRQFAVGGGWVVAEAASECHCLVGDAWVSANELVS